MAGGAGSRGDRGAKCINIDGNIKRRRLWQPFGEGAWAQSPRLAHRYDI